MFVPNQFYGGLEPLKIFRPVGLHLDVDRKLEGSKLFYSVRAKSKTEPIKAGTEGTIINSSDNMIVIVNPKKGLKITYKNLRYSFFDVKKYVMAGDVIGLCSPNRELHVEVKDLGSDIPYDNIEFYDI